MLQEEMEHTFRIGFLLQFDDDADAGPVGLVTDFGDTFDFAVETELFHLLDEVRLVHLIREFGDGDLFTAALKWLDDRFGTDDDLAFAGLERLQDAVFAHDDPARREVRSLHITECVIRRLDLTFQAGDGEVEHLGQVVRRDLGRITGRDPRRPVHEQVREE